jgi:NADH-quinone oxidoreductase subunit K
MIPLSWYLILAAALFCIGLFEVFSRKNAIAVLMGIELMLNAVNINLLAFWHFFQQSSGEPVVDGLVFAAIVFVVAAAETAVALALIISAYRRRETVIVDELNLLKG